VGVVLITRNYKETSQKVNKKTRKGKFKTGKKNGESSKSTPSNECDRQCASATGS
jgi:hypothetical protein